MLNFVKSSVIGLAAGLVNGLFGSGGGTIVVPAAQKWLRVRTHHAHASAIAVILPLSVVSGFIYYAKGADFDWATLGLISLGGVAGGVIGALLLKKIKARWLHVIFGVFMIAAAVSLFFKG